MQDDRFNPFVIESDVVSEPSKQIKKEEKQIERAVIKQELTAPVPPVPSATKNNDGILPPGFKQPTLQTPNLQTPSLPSNAITAPPIDINALKNQAQELKKDIGAPKAQSSIDTENLTPYMLGGGAAALGLGLGAAGIYQLGKKKGLSISERDIKRIEPTFDFDKANAAAVTQPTPHEPQFDVSKTGTTGPMPDFAKSTTGYQGVTGLENLTNGPLDNSQIVKTLMQSENNKADKEGRPRPYADAPALVSTPEQEATAKIVTQESGVTSTTPFAQSENLVTTHQNSLNDNEKRILMEARQLNDITESATPLKPTANEFVGPIKPTPEIPEGRIPNYMEFKTKKGGTKEFKNKQGSDVIGKGGYNWYQGQMGPEAEENWLRTFGRTNQPYSDVTQAVKEGRLKGPVVNEVGRGGSFSRETTVPNFIKGNASLGMLASTGLTAALLGLAGSEKGQEAMAKASKAIKDLGISPDIFTNKAEELGNLGSSYVTAGNPSYQRELLQKLKSTKDPEYKNLLLQELQKMPTSGSAIAPPGMR